MEIIETVEMTENGVNTLGAMNSLKGIGLNKNTGIGVVVGVAVIGTIVLGKKGVSKFKTWNAKRKAAKANKEVIDI